MSRAQLAALAVAAVTVTLGGVSYTVWQPIVPGAVLTDAGITPTHAASCDVRFAPDCLAAARDAGLDAHRYERISFPVYRSVSPAPCSDPFDAGLCADAGVVVDLVLPPGIPVTSYTGQRCVQVLDWASCSLTPCADAGSICALWGRVLPVTMAGQVRPCVRANFDAGLACLRRAPDGGSLDPGDRNVFPRAQAVEVGNCETVAVGCGAGVLAGDDPEADL